MRAPNRRRLEAGGRVGAAGGAGGWGGGGVQALVQGRKPAGGPTRHGVAGILVILITLLIRRTAITIYIDMNKTISTISIYSVILSLS